MLILIAVQNKDFRYSLKTPHRDVSYKYRYSMSRVMRKPTFCICENKDADQLRGNCAADQRLCFRYVESTILPLYKSEISCLYPSSVAVQPGLCRTRSETRTLIFSQCGSYVLSRNFGCEGRMFNFNFVSSW